jgi:hypothetical protein
MTATCRGCGEPLPVVEADPYSELKHENNCLALKLSAVSNALRDMFAMIDEGVLCRDISKDARAGWDLQILGTVRRLADAKKALDESGAPT